MRHSILTLIKLLLATLLVASCGSPKISFTNDIKPIFDSQCLECHDSSGEGYEKSHFLMTSYDDIMKGTKFGPVIIPGDSLSSSLYRMVSHKTSTSIQMPPHHESTVAHKVSAPLTKKHISTIKNWIDQGALHN